MSTFFDLVSLQSIKRLPVCDENYIKKTQTWVLQTKIWGPRIIHVNTTESFLLEL